MKNSFVFFILLLVPLLSNAKNTCFVDVEMNCTAPSNASQIRLRPMTWTPKSATARTALFNSLEVQNDPAACLAFAQIMKTECAIATPVTMVFTTGPAKPMITTLATGFDPNKYCRLPHSKAFKTYFNQAAVAGATPAKICPKTLKGFLPIIESLVQQ
ncbi:MAG: hypothetical protein ACAH59_00100 [Pseudobdellovibrionaceae bacterium]